MYEIKIYIEQVFWDVVIGDCFEVVQIVIGCVQELVIVKLIVFVSNIMGVKYCVCCFFFFGVKIYFDLNIQIEKKILDIGIVYNLFIICRCLVLIKRI